MQIIFGEKYRSLSCSLCSFLHTSLLNSPSNFIYDVIQIINIYALILRTATRNFELPDAIFYPSPPDSPVQGPKVQITVGSFRTELL